jgi:nucleoside-specific outer membrane channel protein Tsx
MNVYNKNIASMKKILLCFFICFSISEIYGQSKVDTEEWIIRKFYEYLRPQNQGSSLKFEDGYIIHQFNGSLYSKAKISDIKQIETDIEKSDGKDAWHALWLYFDPKKIQIKGSYGAWDNKYRISEGQNIKLHFDLTFSENDMPDRMKKAFIHLVKLYGGDAQVKKDPF